MLSFYFLFCSNTVRIPMWPWSLKASQRFSQAWTSHSSPLKLPGPAGECQKEETALVISERKCQREKKVRGRNNGLTYGLKTIPIAKLSLERQPVSLIPYWGFWSRPRNVLRLLPLTSPWPAPGGLTAQVTAQLECTHHPQLGFSASLSLLQLQEQQDPRPHSMPPSHII